MTSNNSITQPCPSFNNISILYSHKIRNLGILIYSKLKFDLHTLSLSKYNNYILFIIHSTLLKTAQLLTTSLTLPRLDYCNSDFHIAHLLLNKTLQKKTHWLHITYRITNKICITVNLSLHHMIPDYISIIIWLDYISI